jgi:hypothetical protein
MKSYKDMGRSVRIDFKYAAIGDGELKIAPGAYRAILKSKVLARYISVDDRPLGSPRHVWIQLELAVGGTWSGDIFPGRADQWFNWPAWTEAALVVVHFAACELDGQPTVKLVEITRGDTALARTTEGQTA